MRSKVSLYCEKCGALVFVGYEYSYEYPVGSGNMKDDMEGRYFYGAGKCAECGKVLCETCGDFTGGVCKKCKEERI
jgi:hypothetical protein